MLLTPGNTRLAQILNRAFIADRHFHLQLTDELGELAHRRRQRQAETAVLRMQYRRYRRDRGAIERHQFEPGVRGQLQPVERV